MSETILPSGEVVNNIPDEILRYMNPDALRQLLRQERLRWHLKVNKDVDYYDNNTMFKYGGEVHNQGYYQRMEIRTFPDNGAPSGYAGLNNDSGTFGIVHDMEKWDETISDESVNTVVNRTMLGAFAKIDNKSGTGLDDNGNMSDTTNNRAAAFLCDPFDGRVYVYSNDKPSYINNESIAPENRLPSRTVARICDIPTRVDQLINDLDYISDPDYKHTDNNFTNSNRYILDNIDDRTFVYPEISRDENGDYIKNIRIGLNGLPGYAESDGEIKQNTQPDYGVERGVVDSGDRGTDAVNSYSKNTDYSGSTSTDGYLQGIFRSLEELEKVDLVGQKMDRLTHSDTPGARRSYNYYRMDGKWSSNWFNRAMYKDSYLAQSLNPNNMEIKIATCEPVPYHAMDNNFDRGDLYQWRYNRIETIYPNETIEINIIESGEGYKENDILRWVFGDDSFKYRVTQVGPNGQIQTGEYVIEAQNVYDQDPSTNGIGVEFHNTTGAGHGAKLEIVAHPITSVNTTQLKNNLYAYVDITPTVRSDNTSIWSDANMPDTQDGRITIRSTAAGPAYSGVNSGKGGPKSNLNSNTVSLYEHGGNPTAGVHVHLFRYVINTQNPTWKIVDGVQVFTGKWVDQGPMGLERPCDIKSLMLSCGDTNCFNNFYKFSLDLLFDSCMRDPDGINTNNPNAVTVPLLHIDQKDPDEDRRFTEFRIDSDTNEIIEVDVTNRVLYINAATGVFFVHNQGVKNDPDYGYAHHGTGWIPLSGVVTS